MDHLTGQQIQYKLKSTVFKLVKNDKGNNALWENDISLIEKKDEYDKVQLLEGWAAYNHCYMAYTGCPRSPRDKFTLMSLIQFKRFNRFF